MAQIYDSAKVRNAARTVRALNERLEDGAMRPERKAFRESEPLNGKAAEALRERLQRLEENTRRICAELGSVSAELNRYANALDEVGAKLTREML